MIISPSANVFTIIFMYSIMIILLVRYYGSLFANIRDDLQMCMLSSHACVDRTEEGPTTWGKDGE